MVDDAAGPLGQRQDLAHAGDIGAEPAEQRQGAGPSNPAARAAAASAAAGWPSIVGRSAEAAHEPGGGDRTVRTQQAQLGAGDRDPRSSQPKEQNGQTTSSGRVLDASMPTLPPGPLRSSDLAAGLRLGNRRAPQLLGCRT